MSADSTNLVASRSCDGCTLCCKLLNIAALKKPALVWCPDCQIGKGCGIYETRPQVCREFYCVYRVSPELGEEWNPTVSKMLINYVAPLKQVNIHTDPAFPGMWRREPYYQQIKTMAQHMLEQKGHLILWDGEEPIVILPDRDVHLGDARGKNVVVSAKLVDGVVVYDAVAVSPDGGREQQTSPRG